MVYDSPRQRADAAYAGGDWHTAAREYLEAAAEGSDVAECLHLAGNALLKLKRYVDACGVYERALDDPTWPKSAQTRTNLGIALAALGRDLEAVDAFRTASEDFTSPVRHKALQGLASALERLDRLDDAAEAYRRAVLVEDNADPGKALNNLGLCYMALGRPRDAVGAYQAALDLETYAAKGKAAANLGLAFEALGEHADAVRAFDRAVVEFGHTLSGPAARSYNAAVAAVEADEARAARFPLMEAVEGWSTGEMPPVLPVHEIDDDIDTPFFTRTDEEMRAADRQARREERSEQRGSRSPWVALGTWLAVLIVVAGLAGYAWVSGFGYPTQSMVVGGLLDAHHDGKDVTGYWVAVPTADVEKEMSNLPPKFADYTIGAIEGSARTSSVAVTITLEQGAPLTYMISLLREGVGWKVNGVTNDWRSTGGGS